ncbi:MAG: tetratricopeptide repeat protein [Haliea sp.]|nr:tetratricopeptide repeat protein [Haliea sp.]
MRFQREGRFSDAYKIYGRVLELSPEEPHALHYLGIMAFAQHQYQDALLLMRRSVEIAPDDLGFPDELWQSPVRARALPAG